MPAFQYSPYENRFGATIAELLQHQSDIRARQALTVGEAQARAAEQSGQAWGQAIGNIGQSVAAIPQQIQQAKTQQLQSGLLQSQIESAKALAAERNAKAALDARLLKGTELLKSTIQSNIGEDGQPKIDAIVNTLMQAGYPEAAQSYAEGLDKTSGYRTKRMERMRQEQQESRDELAELAVLSRQRLATHRDNPMAVRDALLGLVAVAPTNGSASAADAEKFLMQIAEAGPDQLDTVFQDIIKQSETVFKREQAAEKTAGDIAKTAAETAQIGQPKTSEVETARHNQAMEAIGRMTAGRAEAAQAETVRHNRAIEEAARNTKTSRPVLSGDANRIAEIDTSIDDAKLLQTRLAGAGVPGVLSRIGASLPNVVSEVTGWGADAKSRQAVIDLAKQIIGKGLEGGVLRKEDEAKYARILPTIGDAPEVAQAKLTSLISVLGQRRARTIESLSDAGFNVSKYERTEPTKPVRILKIEPVK